MHGYVALAIMLQQQRVDINSAAKFHELGLTLRMFGHPAVRRLSAKAISHANDCMAKVGKLDEHGGKEMTTSYENHGLLHSLYSKVALGTWTASVEH